MYNEGEWIRKPLKHGTDSSLHDKYSSSNYKPVDNLLLGSISGTRLEPVFKENTVDINYLMGGFSYHVAWPGGQYNASSAGVQSPSSQQVHGLWEAPLPGQQVLVGFVDGSQGNPVVINKYPYNPSLDPIYAPAHTSPLIQKQHSPTDVILGHFSGSWIALRGTLPLPGHIDISSVSTMKLFSQLDAEFNVADNAKIKMNATGLISIFNTAQSLKTIMDDLIDTISGLTTFGSPTNHALSPTVITQLTAIKVRLALLLGVS